MCTLCTYNPLCAVDGSHLNGLKDPIGQDADLTGPLFIPANTTTSASITVGGAVDESLETVGDRDWFRLDLSAGETVEISLTGVDHAGAFGALVDPYLRVYDANGSQVAFNDDSNGSLNSRLTFTATSSSSYFLSAGAWDDRYTGDYRLQVTAALPKQEAPLQTLADFLSAGYWGGTQRFFNLSSTGVNAKSGTITYSVDGATAVFGGQTYADLDGLVAARRVLVEDAFNMLSSLLGINFEKVSSTTADIRFIDNESGAFAASSTSNAGGVRQTDFGLINIAANWQGGSSGFASYTYQTIIHEIGHVLGLGHQGSYNGSASFSSSADYLNDNWRNSVMSYFSQDENPNIDATDAIALTYMSADLIALNDLYGGQGFSVSGAFTGDTVWGYNTNIAAGAGEIFHNMSSYIGSRAFTIVDGGGIDTLDLSGNGAGHRIDLMPSDASAVAPTTMDIGNNIANLTLGVGTIIENAIGGAGADMISGNDFTNILTGGGGADVLTGRGGIDEFVVSFDDSYARITDLQLGQETIKVADGPAVATVNATISGTTLRIQGDGGMTDPVTGAPLPQPLLLAQLENLAATSSDAPLLNLGSGLVLSMNQLLAGVDLSSPPQTPVASVADDMTGDGVSDVLWFNSANKRALIYDEGPDGREIIDLGVAGAGYEIQGIGDFSGDGIDDVLWLNTGSGAIGFYDMATTSPVWRWIEQGGTVWDVSGVGDFNGDGTDDILMHNGAFNGIGYYEMDGGAKTWRPVVAGGPGWEVAATGDFTGDGTSDVLWHNQSTGAFGYHAFDGSEVAFQFVGYGGTDWQIAGTGDFDGDEVDEILWFNPTTQFVGYHVLTGSAPAFRSLGQAGSNYEIAGVADYSGDGRDDILWFNTLTRQTGFYEMQGIGTQPGWVSLGIGGPDWSPAGIEPAELLS